MTQALPQVSLGSSRLVRFLTDLSVGNTRVSHRQFTQRLGALIDFSDSIVLAEANARDIDAQDLKGKQPDCEAQYRHYRDHFSRQSDRFSQ